MKIEQYAVVGRFYDNGKVTAHIRPANPGEKSRSIEANRYDEYIDIFDTKEEAEKFKSDYLKA